MLRSPGTSPVIRSVSQLVLDSLSNNDTFGWSGSYSRPHRTFGNALGTTKVQSKEDPLAVSLIWHVVTDVTPDPYSWLWKRSERMAAGPLCSFLLEQRKQAHRTGADRRHGGSKDKVRRGQLLLCRNASPRTGDDTSRTRLASPETSAQYRQTQLMDRLPGFAQYQSSGT